MHAHYDASLVLVSIAVGIFASYVALDLSEHLNRARGYARHVWLLCGSFAMGVGIWSMWGTPHHARPSETPEMRLLADDPALKLVSEQNPYMRTER